MLHKAQRTENAPAGVRAVTHDLKCWPEFFAAIARGEKRHDLRRATDREFRSGDRLLLREFDPDRGEYTGQSQRAVITYITSADMPCALSEQALNPEFCILSISLLSDALPLC
ncbi:MULTISPECIES: DUF3850 domain-containing protein [unclassified Mesorhizobium]|uniref:DUF3850 domain-containing protein n=1 Tax=unclassified Mesorhizobium TaxID=325217 RepID=UPI0009FEC7E1